MSVNNPLLTLEPLIEAVREGAVCAGWDLSGLQKTTSHEYEGRWEGESSRSAYLFFHPRSGPDWVSVDVFLDETSRGLTGNLALVVDIRPLGSLGDPRVVLGSLAGLASKHLPAGYRSPLTLRFRIADSSQDPDRAETEVRFKLRIPASALRAGASACSALTSSTIGCFEALMDTSALLALVATD